MPTPFSVLDDEGEPLDAPAPPVGQPVGQRTAASAVWLIVSRLASKGIDFALLLVLARLLTPADFGVVAIGMTLVQLVEAVLELPVLQVLVRMPRPAAHHYDTAFTMGLARGAALAVALGLAAWPFARFYGDPRVLPIVIALSFAPATRGIQSPRMADWARAIDFRRDVAIEVGGKVAAFVAATAVAIVTHSYWALVVGTVSTPLTMMLLSFVLAPYRPRFSVRDWREFAGFLGWMTGAQLVTAINWQLDRLLLGRFTTRTQLGLYSMANDLSYLPEQAIIRPIMRPLLSAFAMANGDHERLTASYLRTSSFVLAAGLPPILGLSVLAEPAARLALGAKWLPAVPVIQLLALTTVPPLFVAALNPLAIAIGRTSIFLRQSLIELGIRVPLMTAGAALAGMWGVVAVRLFSGAVMAVVSLYFVWEILRTPIRRQLAAAGQPMLAGAVLTLILLALRPLLASLNGPALLVGLGLCALAGAAGFVVTLLGSWKITGRGLGIEAQLIDRLRAILQRARR